jgi:hypothetical protein
MSRVEKRKMRATSSQAAAMLELLLQIVDCRQFEAALIFTPV